MALSEEEAHQLIETILKAIQDLTAQPDRAALVEFIGQWRAEIEGGRPVDRKLKVQESPGLDEAAGVPRARTTTTGDFVGRIEYSKIEQLDLLIEALGLSFIAPPMMAARFLDTVHQYREIDSKDSGQEVSITFAPTGEVGDPALQLDRLTTGQALAATLPLAKLLEELVNAENLRSRLLVQPQASI